MLGPAKRDRVACGACIAEFACLDIKRAGFAGARTRRSSRAAGGACGAVLARPCSPQRPGQALLGTPSVPTAVSTMTAARLAGSGRSLVRRVGRQRRRQLPGFAQAPTQLLQSLSEGRELVTFSAGSG